MFKLILLFDLSWSFGLVTMLTHGIISKYIMKCFKCIFMQTNLFILTNHNDDPWKSINVLKELWGANVLEGTNVLKGANLPRGENFQGGANFPKGTKFSKGENPLRGKGQV